MMLTLRNVGVDVWANNHSLHIYNATVDIDVSGDIAIRSKTIGIIVIRANRIDDVRLN